MFQQEVEEVFFLQSDWCLHCYVMVGGDQRLQLLRQVEDAG